MKLVADDNDAVNAEVVLLLESGGMIVSLMTSETRLFVSTLIYTMHFSKTIKAQVIDLDKDTNEFLKIIEGCWFYRIIDAILHNQLFHSIVVSEL